MIGSFKCRRCKHNHDASSKQWKCDAFPEGIPEEKIMRITQDPCIDCNNGIAFDSIDESENEYRAKHKEELIEQLNFFDLGNSK